MRTPASAAARACVSRQVEPVRLGVDLEERSRLDRRLEDALEVELVRRAPVDLPAGRMADAVDVRVLHRGDQAVGEALAGPVEAGVDRGHDPVALGERLVGEVEAAVGADVDLDAGKDL